MTGVRNVAWIGPHRMTSEYPLREGWLHRNILLRKQDVVIRGMRTLFPRPLFSIIGCSSPRCDTDQARLPHFRGQRMIGDLTMATGTVKWFNTTKGYGFIAPEDGGKDIFVHISAVERSGLTGLADDEPVEFELIEGRDGREMAGNLRKV